jgi:hypothetical protein
MCMRLVSLWSTRAQQAVRRRIASDTRPRRVAYVADGPTRGYRSWPPPWRRWAGFVCLKPHNQRLDITTEEANN